MHGVETGTNIVEQVLFGCNDALPPECLMVLLLLLFEYLTRAEIFA